MMYVCVCVRARVIRSVSVCVYAHTNTHAHDICPFLPLKQGPFHLVHTRVHVLCLNPRWRSNSRHTLTSRCLSLHTHTFVADYTAQAGTGWNPGQSAADYIMCDGVQ